MTDPTAAEIAAGAEALHSRSDAGYAPTASGILKAREHTAAVLQVVLPDHDARVEDAARVPLLDIIADLADPNPCRYDHHDLCQEHSLHQRPCPHTRAQRVLARWYRADATAPEGDTDA